MKKEEIIKLKIEKLKDEKENIKFAHGSLLNAYIAIIIFLAVTGITVLQYISEIEIKIVVLLLFLGLMIGAYYIFFKPKLSERYKKLVDKAKKIEDLYNQLIKE